MRYMTLLFFLLFYSIYCHATIYMQTDKFGNITYSDTPLSNSQKVELPAVNSSSSNVQTVPSTAAPTTAEIPPLTTVVEESKSYTQFSILSPKDQETIQNQPTIPVEIALKPKLQSGDKIQLLVDGKLSGEALASTILELGIVERGTHQLSAVILNANQQVIQQTNPITIYVHRANSNSSPAIKQGVSSSTSSDNNFLQTLTRFFKLG